MAGFIGKQRIQKADAAGWNCMLYKKYTIFDNTMEIMVPSCLKMEQERFMAGCNWFSQDKKMAVNAAKGSGDLSDEGLYLRLGEYYKRFSANMAGFECGKISRRDICGRPFGEMRYTTDILGYSFYNVFMLGRLKDRELVINMQGVDGGDGEIRGIFDNVSASVRIFGEREGGGGSDNQ